MQQSKQVQGRVCCESKYTTGNQGSLLRGGDCSTKREIKIYQRDEEARDYRKRHEQRYKGMKRDGMCGEISDSMLLGHKVRVRGSCTGGEQVQGGQLGWAYTPIGKLRREIIVLICYSR